MQMFEDLPARKEEDIEPLTILALPPPKEEKPIPEAGKQTPLVDDKGDKKGVRKQSLTHIAARGGLRR